MTTAPINKTDLAMLKLTYSAEEFGLLEAAIKHEPDLVSDFVSKVRPTDFNDTAAYDRIVCSLFVHAREQYEINDTLPFWAEEWFAANWPYRPYHQFADIDIFDVNSRYNHIALVSK